MTDFAQEPLWEEEQAEPEKLKILEEEERDPMRQAGNAAILRSMPGTLRADAIADTPPDAKRPVSDLSRIKTRADRSSDDELMAVPKARDTQQAATSEWEKPLAAVLTAMQRGGLDKALPPFLDCAAQIPPDKTRFVSGLIVAAFLGVAAPARQPVRNVLVAALRRWPDLAITQLILVRLGGLPVAPPPPTPPADP